MPRPKQYGSPEQYESKLPRVMARMGVDSDKVQFNWTRTDCFVEFWYKGQLYRFTHSVQNAKEHGNDIVYGSDAFAQLILALEDLARLIERGIYDLGTWISGMKALPASTQPSLPAECQRWLDVMGFQNMPRDGMEIQRRFVELVKVYHPDTGGSNESFVMLQAAKKGLIDYLDANQ